MNFDGVWSDPGSDPREAIDYGRGEMAVVATYPDHYRMTFELKCEGLDAGQLATRSVPPSTLSLLGLVRHLAPVEHSWTRRCWRGSRNCRGSIEPKPSRTPIPTGQSPTSRGVGHHGRGRAEEADDIPA